MSFGITVYRIFAVLILLNAADGLVTTIAPAFLGALGFPLEQIGVLVAGYAIASLISRLPAGRLADSRFALVSFYVGCVVYAGALALYPVAVEPWAFWTVRAVHGLAIGLTTTLVFAAFLGAAQGKSRSRATIFYTTFMAVGYSLGNLVSGFLADRFGFGVAFLVGATFPLVAFIAMPRVGLAVSGAAKAGATASFGTLLRSPAVMAVPVVAFAMNFVFQALNTLFPLYVLSIGLSLTVAGTTRSSQSMTNVLARPFGDILVRGLGTFWLAIVGLVIVGFVGFAVPLTTFPLVFVALFILLGLGRGCIVVSNTLSTGALAERGVINRGTASALINAGLDAGAVVGPVLAGWLAGNLGIGPALQILSPAVALLGIVAMLLARGAITADEATLHRDASEAPPAAASGSVPANRSERTRAG